MKKLTTALVAICAAMGAYASTSISGNFTIDHTLDATERPLIITGDATITVQGDLNASSVGIVSNVGHHVTINLEEGSRLRVDWFTVRNNGTTTINFKGGSLTDAGGSFTHWFDTEAGSTVELVSVDGKPIRLAQVNSQLKYWNRKLGDNTQANWGRVTTSGSGRCELLSADWNSTKAEYDYKYRLVLRGCTTADWGHTGGTYLGCAYGGTKGYVWCDKDNVLPPGDIYLGTYDTYSPVELNLYGHSQAIDRLHLQVANSTVISSSGTPALVFSSANSAIDITSGANSANMSLPAISVAAGATLTVDKALVSVSALADNGTLAYANGGKLTLNLSNASDAIAISASAPASGATAIVKSGAGTYSYAGDAALDIDALTVNAGEFRLSGPRGTTNRWWRFTVKQGPSAGSALEISNMRLFGSDLKPADGIKPDPNYPSVVISSLSRVDSGDVSAFSPYNYRITYQQGNGIPKWKAAWQQHGSGQTMDARILWYSYETVYGCEFTDVYPRVSDPNTWITWTFRIPDGRPIRGYNLRKNWGFTKYPRYWTLESSPDGSIWETMDEQSNYPVYATDGTYWFNGAGNGPSPTSLIDFDKQVKPTLPTTGGLASDVNIKVASGATFDASLVTGGQEISTLTVDYAGGGTLKGVRFAFTGTLYLQNVPAGTDINEFAIPLTFVGAADTANLANWTAVISFSNGTSREKKLYWDNGVMRIRPSGITIIIR